MKILDFFQGRVLITSIFALVKNEKPFTLKGIRIKEKMYLGKNYFISGMLAMILKI